MAYVHRNVTLRGYTYRNLYEALDKSDDDFTKYLQELGLLHSKRTCRKCGCFCEQITTRGNIQFRCLIFELSYYWCRNNVNFAEMAFQTRRWDETTLAEHTWVDWKQFFRDVCAEFFTENPIQIGGPGVFVEIDETFLARRKYQRGRVRKNHGQWIFGGVTRGDASQCFMVPVEKRNADTLLPIIQKHVRPGSIVVSDLWKAYWTVGQLPQGYQHLTINHSLNFVDPTNANVHTQSVENRWSRFKKKHRQRHGCPKHMLVEYISEFLWRQKNKGPDVFFHFWDMKAKMMKRLKIMRKMLKNALRMRVCLLNVFILKANGTFM
ncbi:hypothetical protein AAVH_42617 [Aphelenchoides avenae]|nr:hypothetical protein AAVH_42617 [Aphelenchus avenae]